MKKIIRLTESDLTRIVRKVILESGLNRLHKHIIEHDCAIITAYRDKMVDCYYDVKNAGERLTKSQKAIRNQTLKRNLMQYGYSVTNVVGSYIEGYLSDNQIEVKENSLFVSNMTDDPNFINNIKKFGRLYCQDSVLIIKKGGKDNFLIGTNNTNFPGLNNIVKLSDFKPGNEGEFMTKIGNRPFTI